MSDAGPITEQPAPSDADNRRFTDDRPWHQRALEPELVPEPPAGGSSIWPMMLRLGAVCIIAAMVSAAVVFLFSPKQSTHKIAQVSASPSVSGVYDAAPSSIEPSAGVPALAVETSAAANNAPPPPAQAQVALATPPPMPAAQVEVAAPPQLTRGKVVTARQTRSPAAADRIPSRAKRASAGRERADIAADRRQSGGHRSETKSSAAACSGADCSGPDRSGPSRSAEHQACSRARRE